MMFYIAPENTLHLARHFAGSDVAGSHFDLDAFPTIESFVEYINEHEPHEVIEQSENKKAYLFRHHLGTNVGTCGIAKRTDIPSNDIIVENRDGFQIEIGLVKELPKTQEFCVIASETDRGKSVITAFPGMYAPPFPAVDQNKEDYLKSNEFWLTYVLINARPN
jgi:hypothetical protein